MDREYDNNDIEENLVMTNEARDKKRGETLESYNVMLNLTDISYGVKGHNKFYQIWISKRNGKFILNTKWGRVGAKNPQSKMQEYDSKIEVVRDFKKQFWKKTLNEWDDRANFET